MSLALFLKSATTGRLSVSADSRYLLDSDGNPFFLVGDAAWAMFGQLTTAEAATYLSTRAGQGYNAILASAPEKYFCLNAPNNRANVAPYSTPGDFSTPNETYWATVDTMIASAGSNGIVVFMCVPYLGYGGGVEGWWATLTNETNTQAVCFAYGQFLGNRYKTTPNIVWVLGGDYTWDASSEGETRLHKIGEGIRDSGDTHLITTHMSRNSLSTGRAAMLDLIQINGSYRANDTWLTSLGWEYSGPLPCFLIEDYYVGENSTTAKEARTERWNAVLSGSITGAFQGHGTVWAFNDTALSWDGSGTGGDWQDAILESDATDFGRMAAFLRTLSWWLLLPSNETPMRRLIPSSNGDPTVGATAYISAACASNGTLLLAHAPYTGSSTATQTFTVDCRDMAGNSRGRWWNPVAGTFSNVTDGSYDIANTEAAYSVTTPGANGGSANDWVLILETA